MVIFVRTSGMARHICLRLFASRMLRTRIFLALIALAIFVKVSTFASTVTRIISYGSAFTQVRSVSSSSSPPVAIVGQMIVTSWELYVGFSGIGIGRNVQWEMQFTSKRIYRNNLITWLARCACETRFGAGTVGRADLVEKVRNTHHAKTATQSQEFILLPNERRGWEGQSLHRTSA